MTDKTNERLSLFKVFMSPTATEDLSPVLRSGFITQGKKVDEFEKALQVWFDYPHILTLNAATSGLTLALHLGFNPKNNSIDTDGYFNFCNYFNKGDKILCSPLTCFATIAPVLAKDLSIVWADTDIETGNVSLEDVEKKLNEHNDIKGMIFVHWAGNPIDLDRLQVLRREYERTYGIFPFLVEDCAHSFGAGFGGKKLGAHCAEYDSIAVFSLQAIKHLTTGDGGLIFLPNKAVYERAKLLRWYGIDRLARTNGKDFRLENDIPEWGYKFHMNDINATIGLSNLPHMGRNLLKVQRNAEYYKKELKEIPSVKLMKENEKSTPSYWIFTIRIQNKHEFIPFADERGVMVSQVHNRNDKHSCVIKYSTPLPMLDQLSEEIVCIPCGWWIGDEDRKRVVDVIREWDGICLDKKKVARSNQSLEF